MSKKAKSADLIMKLYDLRREATMREARNWFVAFFPTSADEVMKVMIDPKTSAFYRMVTTYWEMAAGFVVHGAIDREMFLDSSGEFLIVFAKVQPFLKEIRESLGSPGYLKNLVAVVTEIPDFQQVLDGRREQMKRWMKARADLAESAYAR
jgi:hypothetical protein